MKYYCDGFLRGPKNPSPIGGGFTVVNDLNELVHREEVQKSNFTNNEAEILGILQALRMCSKGDTISTDSLCALTWVQSGKSKVRPDLTSVLQECFILKYEKRVNLMWEGRDFNLAGIYNESVQDFHRKNNKILRLQAKQLRQEEKKYETIKLEQS